MIMGQISNISTLRIHERNLNLTSFERKDFLSLFQFLIYLRKFFIKKGAILVNFNCNHSNDTFFLEIELFFKTVRIQKLRKKRYLLSTKKKNSLALKRFWFSHNSNSSILKDLVISKKQLLSYGFEKLIKRFFYHRRYLRFFSCRANSFNNKKILCVKRKNMYIPFRNSKKHDFANGLRTFVIDFQLMSISNLFFQKSFFSKKNSIVVNFCNLNKRVCYSTTIFFYQRFKRYMKLLFSRQNNLFFDFIKISSLFIHKKITSFNFISLLSLIFKSLHKKKHSFYLYFLNDLFTEFVDSKSTLFNKSKIKGIKFSLKGKILGKLRSSKTKIVLGSIPIKTLNSNIKYSQTHTHTLYGSFGLKFWVNYK